MRAFIVGIALSIVAAAAAAVIVELAPIAPLRVAATLLLAGVVFFAARRGAPSWPVLGHLFGVFFAMLVLAVNWIVWIVVIADYDPSALTSLAGAGPTAWGPRLETLALEEAVQVGGRRVEGGLLTGFWIGQAVLLVLAGLFGGHSAMMIGRARRRAARG